MDNPAASPSPQTAAEPLGERLRAKRCSLDLTLQDVADGAGLSVGFISQVERGLTTPSLSSLAGISRVLKSHITDFLSVPGGSSELTRHDKRPVYAVDEKSMTYERISTVFPKSTLNSVIIHEPPGHRSEPIRHEGEELFFILNGAITVEVDSTATILEAGDSIHFDSMRRHSTWNHTLEPAVILHICTMDVFGDDPALAGMPGNRAGHATSPPMEKNVAGTNQNLKPGDDHK